MLSKWVVFGYRLFFLETCKISHYDNKGAHQVINDLQLFLDYFCNKRVFYSKNLCLIVLKLHYVYQKFVKIVKRCYGLRSHTPLHPTDECFAPRPDT